MVLRQAARDTPREPEVPLNLLPADGVRWETMESAVNHAVGVPDLEMSVVETITVSDGERVFYLVDAHAWPARVTVRDIDDSPGIEVEAVMGPDPSDAASRRKAEVIRTRVLASIAKYGRIRHLPAYKVSSRPDQQVER